MKLSTIIYYSILKMYHILPCKNVICYLLRKLPLNKEKFYKDYKFNGPFRVKFNSGQTFKMIHHRTTIENEIYWKGIDNGWEKVSIGVWKELAKNSNVIVDIGANTGVYSLIAASANHQADIYAFEPSKRVFEKLKRNIYINQFDVQAFDIALSNKKGTAIFYDVIFEHQYSASLNESMLESDEGKVEVEVQTDTLDGFFELQKVDKVDLVKVDVEKHECEVLEGMKKIIDRDRPTLLIEILDDVIGEYVDNMLSPYGYLYFDIDEKTSPRKVENLRKSAHYNYLICLESVARELKLI